MKNSIQKFAVIAWLMSSALASAVPFSSFETRSMAMGGTGVAVGSPDAAPLFNPALLSVSKPQDDFALILPTLGVRISDPDKLQDSLDAFEKNDSIGKLNTAITNLNAAVGNTAITAAANQVSTAITNVSNQLATLSNKPIAIDGGAATVVAIPSKKFSAAFYANTSIATGGVFKYEDATTLNSRANDATLCAADPTGNAANCTTLKNFSTNSLASGINFRGVSLGEIGFSFSREFTLYQQNIALGITPKIIKAKLYDAVIKANNSNQSADDYLAEYNLSNFDLGAAKDHQNGWRSGLVIKNIIPQTLDFKRAPTAGATPVATGEQLSLRPQARIGVSHSNSWSTVAMDLDLTRNAPAGLESATQYLALGVELDAWNWAQLRAGYRADLVNSARNVTSIGLGLSPFGVHVDIAVASNANEIGASLQLGLRF